MDNIASIFIDVNLNTSKLQKDLLALENRKLNINVNDQSLTNLNKHLDLKVSHFKQVQNFFNSNPLKIKVDDSALTRLNQNLSTISKNKVQIEFDNSEIDRNVQSLKKSLQGMKLQMTLDKSDLSRQIQESANLVKPVNVFSTTTINKGSEASTKSLEDSLAQKIGKSVAKAVNGNFIGNAISGVLNKSVGSIFTGAFENLGKDLTKSFTKGFTESINQGLNASIGDSTLVGNKLGSSIVQAISSKIPDELKKELQDSINLVLGEVDIVIASQASKRVITKKQEKNQNLAEEQNILERQNVLRSNKQIKSDILDTDVNLKVNTKKQDNLRDKYKELVIKAENDTSKELAAEIKKVSNNLDFLMEQEYQLLARQEKLNLNLEKSKKDLERVKNQANLIQPQSLPQVYAQALKDIAGTKFDVKKAPKLVVDDATLKAKGASALYGVESNTITVSAQMREAIETGKLTAQQMIDFYHEIQHALDFDFGSVRGVQAAKSKVILTKPIQPTKEELKQISPLISRYNPEDRLIEINAEVAGIRKGNKAFNQRQKLTTSAEFIEKYGADASKFNKIVDAQMTEVKNLLLQISTFAKSKSVDVSEDINNFLNEIKQAREKTNKASKNIQSIQEQDFDLASIETFSNNILESFQDLQKLEQKLAILKLEVFKKAQSKTVDIPLNIKEPEKVVVTNQGKSTTQSANSSVKKAPLVRESIISASMFDDGVKNIREKILPTFRSLFKDIQNDLNKNKLDFIDDNEIGALAKAKTLLESLKFARKDIEQTRADLNIPKIGGVDSPKINQMLSQLKAIENKVKRELELAKNKIEVKQGDSDEDTFARLNPLKINRNSSKEEKEHLREINKMLSDISDNMDDFDFKYEKAGQNLTKTFQNASKSVNEFFENVLKGKNDSEGFGTLLAEGLDGLTKIFAGFVGFNVLSGVIEQLKEFNQVSLQTAREMQTLNRQVVFSAGGGVSGEKFLADIRKTAEDFRLNIQNTLTAASGFKTATEGTSIEGALGDATFKNFNQLLAARGTTQSKASNFLLALEQSASKGIQAEELRGQMAEAVPGIISLFSRSQGMTNKQFLNKMRSTPGGLDQSILFEASQQAAAESQLSLDSSFNTLDSKIANFENKLLRIQETVGNTLIPLESIKFDFAASGIDFLVNNLKTISKLITSITVVLTKDLWWNGLKIAKDLIVSSSVALKNYLADMVLMQSIQTAGMTRLQAVGFITTNIFTGLKTAVVGLGKAFAPLLIAYVGIELLGASFNTLKALFSDLSGEVGKFAENATKANQELENLFKTGKKESKIEFATDATSQSKIYNKNRNFLEQLNPLDTGLFEGNKKAQDTLKATEKLVAASGKLRENADSGVVFGSIQELAKIDSMLADIKVKTDSITLYNPQDTQKIKELREQQAKLSEERGAKVLNIGAVQKEVETRIKELKSTREELTKQAENGFIFEENYKKSVGAIDDELKKLELQQDKITKAIGKSKTAFDLLKLSIQEAFTKLEDSKQRIETLGSLQKIQISKQTSNGMLTQGNATYLNSIADIQNQIKLQNASREYIRRQENNFQNPESTRVLQAYNINNRSGVNQINALAERVENENQKFILQEFAKLQQARNELVNFQLQIAQAQEQFRNQLREQTKQVQEYYRNISRNFQETQIEISKLSLQTKNLQTTNKLRESISSGYETIIGTLVSGIEEALNSFTSAADKALDSQKDLLTTQFNIQDSVRSGQELSRSLPSIKVDLDFSSIPNDSNVSQLHDEIDETIGGSEQLGNSINESVKISDSLGTSLDSLLNPLIENDKETQQIFKNLTDSNDATNKINDSTNQWNNNIQQITPQIQNIKTGFDGLLESITSIFLKTNEWLAGLLKAPEILQGITSNASQHSFVQGLQQIGNGLISTIQNPTGKVAFVDRSRSSMDSAPGHIGDDIFAPIGSKIYSPLAGTIVQSREGGTKNTDDADPLTPGYQPQQLVILKLDMPIEFEGKKITHFNMRHLLDRNVQVGQKVKMGDLLGTVGEAGGRGTQFGTKNSGTAKDADAAHLHIEYSPEENNQRNSLPDAAASRLTAKLSENFKKLVTTQTSSKLSLQNVSTQTNNTQGGISRGGNLLSSAELAKLTPLGRQLYAYQQNPNVLAFADTVARAEGTDFRSNSKNFGYSMLIGGSHDTDFSRHPFAGNSGSRIRKPMYNSTASGRYQMMDFNYSMNAAKRMNPGWDSDASRIFRGENPGSFSPAVQDLYFVYSLKKRGVLDKVLSGNFEGALKTKGIAQHYASLQSGASKSAYGGQGTPEGQLRNTIPFAQQRLIERLKGSNQQQVLSPGSLQSTIQDGTKLNILGINQRSEAQQENLEAQRKRDLIAGETALNRVKRQTERVVRESEDKATERARALTDAKFEAIPFPTVDEQNRKASTDILRKKQDSLRQFRRELDDAKNTVKQADELIKSSSESLAGKTDPNRQRTLQTGIQQAEKLKKAKLAEIKDINSKIAETSKAFDAQENARFEKANFEEYLRSSKAAIDLQTQENQGLQERINHLEKIREISPTDVRVDMLPELKRELAFNQLEVETATKLLDIEEKIKKAGNDPKITNELKKQLVTLESQNDAKVRTIELTNQQALKEVERTKILRDINIRSKFSDIENQFADGRVKYEQRINSKDAFGMDTGALETARFIYAESQTNIANIELDKQIQDFKDFARENGLAANQVNAVIENFKILNEVKLTNIKNELDDLINTDKIAEMQKVRENLQTQFNLKEHPRLDLINSQADKYEQRGGNQFVANAMRRSVGREQELFARDQALKNLDEQVASARNRGIEVTDKEVANLRNNIVAISEIKLDNLNHQFKNIATSLGDIANQGLKTFSQGIADLITKGGSLEDVFDNMFNNILNSVINLGLNSLMGGLFGGGGGFLGGLFYSGQLPKNYASGSVPIHTASLNNALRRERMQSGRNPELAIVHSNELIIPAGRTEELAKMGLSPEMLLGRNYANGQMPNGVRSALVNRESDSGEIRVKTEVINNVEYASLEQLQMAMNEAAKRGAEQGSKQIQLKMQNSSSFRNSVGI